MQGKSTRRRAHERAGKTLWKGELPMGAATTASGVVPAPLIWRRVRLDWMESACQPLARYGASTPLRDAEQSLVNPSIAAQTRDRISSGRSYPQLSRRPLCVTSGDRQHHPPARSQTRAVALCPPCRSTGTTSSCLRPARWHCVKCGRIRP